MTKMERIIETHKKIMGTQKKAIMTYESSESEDSVEERTYKPVKTNTQKFQENNKIGILNKIPLKKLINNDDVINISSGEKELNKIVLEEKININIIFKMKF
jgi:ABC-type iron transport system FetAB ATPase subunit